MIAGARELVRLGEALTECAARLDVTRNDESLSVPAEVERVRRLLLHIADEVSLHAATVRRLDDEIELLSRRHAPDARQLADLRRRRHRSEIRAADALDAATRTLVPGGDRLDPVAILRRLTGVRPEGARSYFGRPPVDRSERVRRLGALLLRGSPLGHQVRQDLRLPLPAVSPGIFQRSVRIARARHRLLRSIQDRPTTGASS